MDIKSWRRHVIFSGNDVGEARKDVVSRREDVRKRRGHFREAQEDVREDQKHVRKREKDVRKPLPESDVFWKGLFFRDLSNWRILGRSWKGWTIWDREGEVPRAKSQEPGGGVF